MLVDELREQLKSMSPDLEAITTYWKNSTIESDFKRLEGISLQETFWQNPDQAKISQELQRLREQRDAYNEVQSGYQELSELVELFAQEEQELQNDLLEKQRIKNLPSVRPKILKIIPETWFSKLRIKYNI